MIKRVNKALKNKNNNKKDKPMFKFKKIMPDRKFNRYSINVTPLKESIEFTDSSLSNKENIDPLNQ